MTVTDPRLAQIAINIEQQRQWLVQVMWATRRPKETADEVVSSDIVILGAIDDLLLNCGHLLKLVQE